jgi:DNA polymerase III subunit alpha
MYVQLDLNSYFRFKCEKGFVARGFNDLPPAQLSVYKERFEYEYKVITDMGFAGYFLIVEDILRYARDNKVPCGIGRGSAAASILSYCLYITHLDPIEWNLPFSRFLNEDRASMPDIDLDVSEAQRSIIVDYIKAKYGESNVCHIGTFGLMRAKNAVKNVARVLGHPYSVGDYLSSLLLPSIHGKPQSLRTSIDNVPELSEHYAKNGAYGEILRWAEKFENLCNSFGQHACGILISNSPLTSAVPVSSGKTEDVVSQYEMNDLERQGYIKFDILGLTTLTKVSTALNLIKNRHGIDIDIYNLDWQDQTVFEEFRSGNVTGVFQFEKSSGMKDLTVSVRPTSLADLSALVALFRPGPLSSDGMKDYLTWRAGQLEPDYLIPELKSILKDTGNLIIYQEQIMKIATDLCGYSGPDSDDLRKAVGKKLPDKMATHEAKFKTGWTKNGYPLDVANKIWNNIVKFASYGFCLAHAASYGTTAYITAYLKTHYPIEWMCAVLTCDRDDKDQIIKYVAECKRLSIRILPPDINSSQEYFSIDSNNDIRFGLAPIKNLGKEPVRAILENRRQAGLYKSLEDFCLRSESFAINRRQIESLVLAGCFEFLGYTRNSLLDYLERLWNYKTTVKSYLSKLLTYNKRLTAYEQRLKEVQMGLRNDRGALVKSKKCPEQPVSPKIPILFPRPEIEKRELLAREFELLGQYITGHPLDGLYRQNYLDSDIVTVKQVHSQQEVVLPVVVVNKQLTSTKKAKKEMAFLTFQDRTGQIDAVAFPKVYGRYKALLTPGSTIRIFATTEIVEGETESVVKLTVVKVQKLDIAYSVVPRKKLRTPYIQVNIQEVSDVLDLLKSSNSGNIEVGMELTTSYGAKIQVAQIRVDQPTRDVLVSRFNCKE